MKINHVSGALGAYNQRAVRKADKAGEVAQTSKRDEVVLSSEAKEVLGLKERVARVPAVREQRIADLRSQIQAGTYNPDSREIAARMLQARIFDDLA